MERGGVIRELFKMWVPVEFSVGFVSGLLFALVIYGVMR